MNTTRLFIMMLTMVGLISSCCGNNNQCKREQEATASVVTTPEKSSEKKTVIARITVKEGAEDEFLALANTLVEASLQEEGNLTYALYQSPTKPTLFIVFEEYLNDEAFKTHAASAHFNTFVQAIEKLVAEELIVDEF